MSYIILDLDNCIADDEWRIPSIDWAQQDLNLRYNDYHALASFDEPGNHDLWAGRPEGSCVVITARPAMFRAPTLHWLKTHGVPVRHLLMRNDGEHTPSALMKAEKLDLLMLRYGIRAFDIEAAYDDRADVVEMYRRSGLVAHVRCIHKTCAMTPPRRQR